MRQSKEQRADVKEQAIVKALEKALAHFGDESGRVRPELIPGMMFSLREREQNSVDARVRIWLTVLADREWAKAYAAVLQVWLHETGIGFPPNVIEPAIWKKSLGRPPQDVDHLMARIMRFRRNEADGERMNLASIVEKLGIHEELGLNKREATEKMRHVGRKKYVFRQLTLEYSPEIHDLAATMLGMATMEERAEIEEEYWREQAQLTAEDRAAEGEE